MAQSTANSPGLPAVDMQDITMRFARVVANDHVSLRVRAGEVHALVGENGAGKSTLMRVLCGLYRPDSGKIYVRGHPVRFHSPADAIAAGIGMVHQHFMLVPPFTVTENVILGAENAGRGGILRPRRAATRIAEIAERYRISVEPMACVSALSVGEQQRVEILKVLYRKADIIVLDEPTAVLTPQEVDMLLHTIGELRDSGKTVIIITHKLREVMAVSDRVTVLRGGRNVGEMDTASTSPQEIARMMVGRDVLLPSIALTTGVAGPESRELQAVGREPQPEAQASAKPIPGATGQRQKSPETPGPPLLRISRVSLVQRGRGILNDICLEIHSGEILGIAGVDGNGQAELVEVLTGLRKATRGSVEICGTDVTHAGPRARLGAGLACVPEDRHRKGIILDFTLRENLQLGRLGRNVAFSRAKRLLEDYDVRPPDPRERAVHLSGGNQQKLIVAREFTRGARVIVASQPTRGIDLGAVEFVHERLLQLRANGAAILLISAELSEILSLSDRVAVLFGGRLVFETLNQHLTEHQLGIYMAGAQPGEPGEQPDGH